MIFLENAMVTALYLSLLVHVVLMVIVAGRLWNGENVIDRLMASDLLASLALAVLVLVALIHRQKVFLEVGLGLAALGYVTIIAFSKYITDKHMY